MKRRILSVILSFASVPAFAGVAYAVSQSVDPNPAPEVVLPAETTTTLAPGSTSVTVDDHGGDRPAGVSDDNPATHDVGDDHGGDRPAGVSDDDPATHDVGDDHGGSRTATTLPRTTVTTVDDHGGDRPAGVSDDDPATHDVGDNHGGSSGGGSSSDDGGHHRGSDG